MLDKEKDIDALTISTPDHNHARVPMIVEQSITFMYKTLTHTIAEARLWHKPLKKTILLLKWVTKEDLVLEFPKFKSGLTKTKLEKYTLHTLGPTARFGLKE